MMELALFHGDVKAVVYGNLEVRLSHADNDELYVYLTLDDVRNLLNVMEELDGE